MLWSGGFFILTESGHFEARGQSKEADLDPVPAGDELEALFKSEMKELAGRHLEDLLAVISTVDPLGFWAGLVKDHQQPDIISGEGFGDADADQHADFSPDRRDLREFGPRGVHHRWRDLWVARKRHGFAWTKSANRRDDAFDGACLSAGRRRRSHR